MSILNINQFNFSQTSNELFYDKWLGRDEGWFGVSNTNISSLEPYLSIFSGTDPMIARILVPKNKTWELVLGLLKNPDDPGDIFSLQYYNVTQDTVLAEWVQNITVPGDIGQFGRNGVTLTRNNTPFIRAYGSQFDDMAIQLVSPNSRSIEFFTIVREYSNHNDPVFKAPA